MVGGMEHRAFLFDTEKYHAEIEQMILDAGSRGDAAALEQYIDAHLRQLKSPYTADPLADGWRDELESGDVQELADFVLTLCYDPEADLGLGEDWETLCGAMEELDLSGGTEYYFIGEEIRAGNFVLDPSGMGMGIIEPDNIELIYDELDGAAPDLEANDDELLSELYRSLMEIYETARVHSKGLLMTF
ncbi:MAG TPA: hypothetical protein IAB39_10130 [Candidatus Onthovicinus excrementipullorum]|nr:hypothetical protein [Candidatus Onthovicinus excrementipullorum]